MSEAHEPEGDRPPPPEELLSTDSESLLSLFARGDDSALHELIDREGPKILRRLEARMPARFNRRFGASDILQHTAIDLLQVRQRFENHGMRAFRAMLARMADLNLARAIQRERAKKRDIIREHSPPAGFVDDSSPWYGGVDGVAAENSTPSKAAQRGEAADAVKRCFEQLPPADQEIIEWIDYRELPYEAVAEQLKLTVKTTQKRHSRAVARLRELLEREQRESS